MTGAARCQARSEHLTLRGGEIVASAEAALRARLREEGETDAEVESTSPPIDRLVAPRPIRRRAPSTVVDARMSRAGAVVDVCVRVDGETAHNLPVSFRIRRFREAIAARLPVKAGEPFARDNVELRRVEVTSLPFTPVSDESVLAGKVAVRAIRAGQPITVADFRDAPLVRRGEIVTIRARAGSVEITTRGVAQSDGAREALIPVLNVSSQKVVFAKVENNRPRRRARAGKVTVMNRIPHLLVALAALTAHASSQSLYKRAGGRGASLVSDLRASGIGDILTVVIREEHKIEQEDKTNRATRSTFNAKVDAFQIANTNLAPKFPSIDANSERTFDGNAKQERDGSFEARVAVTVVDVLPNGNLVVSGRRTVQVDDEEKTLRISGVVRPLDVTATNTVNSAQVAEARVAIEGKGPSTEANTRGPVGAFFQTLWWAIWPF